MSERMSLREDGRINHYFGQSWVNSYMNCPEQARRRFVDIYPSDLTEVNAVGTAVHKAIDHYLTELAAFEEAMQVAHENFQESVQAPEFRWVKTRKAETCLRHIEGALRSFYVHVPQTLGAAVWVEEPFDFILYEDDERVVNLRGVVDYGQANGLKDWKVTGNQDKYGKREGWQLTRWAVQPTFYAAAAYERGLFQKGETVPFQYVALSPQGRKPQWLDANREWGHIEWLKEQLHVLCLQREAGLAKWPLRDHSALCSPKWCMAYDDCKGRFVDINRKEAAIGK